MVNSTHLSPAPLPPIRVLPPLAALLAFERAAAHLSFRRAARDLALSPSAVSHQIRGLEARFGLRLFARGGRQVRLTADGERYYRAVTQGLGQLEDATRELLGQGSGPRRELRVSALPFFTSTVLMPALADFRARFPRLDLRLEATHAYADFDAAEVDVAIRFGRERATGLKLETLLEVRRQPVCAPSLLAHLKTPEDLASQTLIQVSAQPGSWTAWLAERGLAGLTPAGVLWVDSTTAALDAAGHGLGVALAMHPLIERWRGYGETLVPVFGPPAGRPVSFHLVYRPEQAGARWLTGFRDWLKEAVQLALSGASPAG